MNLRNKTVINNEIMELGKEFWGLISFETNLTGLYEFLDVNKFGVALTTLANWIVFPELMPPDIRNSIRLKIIARYQTEEYKTIPYVLMTKEQTEVYEHTLELLNFKYNNATASPGAYKRIYSMRKESFEAVLHQFIKYGYLDKESMFKYYDYYLETQEGK